MLHFPVLKMFFLGIQCIRLHLEGYIKIHLIIRKPLVLYQLLLS